MDSQRDPNVSRLFVLSSLALFTAGLSFSLRGAIAGGIDAEILSQVDPANSGRLTAEVLGIAFSGFAFTLFFGSVFLERIGMGRSLFLAGLSLFLGTALVVFSDRWGTVDQAYLWLRVGYLFSGFGWGFVEAASNPLVAALYPDDKTHRLKVLHAWWPAGIVVGGLMGVAIAAMGLPWELNMFVLMLPALALANTKSFGLLLKVIFLW